MKELLTVQNLLDNMGSEDVRNDFVEGKRGAVKLSEENLNQLDELYKLISPTRDGETKWVGFLFKPYQNDYYVSLPPLPPSPLTNTRKS